MIQYRFAKEEMPERRSPEGKGRHARLIFDPQVIPGAHCSMAILRYEAGGVGPAHEHETEVEVFFGLRGMGEIEFQGKAHRLEPGVAIYVPPRTRHLTRNIGVGDLEFVCFFAPAADLGFIRGWEVV
ncbi:MAG: cupin domain-containing protein [Thermodesulfobacteriota bacterium]